MTNETNQNSVELVKKGQQFRKDAEPVIEALDGKLKPFVHALKTFLESDEAKRLGKQFGDIAKGLHCPSRLFRQTTLKIYKIHQTAQRTIYVDNCRESLAQPLKTTSTHTVLSRS